MGLILGSEWTLLLLALAAGLGSAVISDVLTPAVIRVAELLGAFSRPEERHIHASTTPRLGGVAIAGGVFGGCGLGWLLSLERMDLAVPGREALSLILATAAVFLVGTVDDITGSSVWKRVVVETFAAAIVVSAGWQFSSFSLPGVPSIELGVLAPVCTVLWILAVTNAINLFDGMDGLACGGVSIIAGSLLVFSLVRGDRVGALVFASIVGACLGFLRHNRAPAKIFLGDSGSLTLGFLLGAMSVQSSLKTSTAIAILVPAVALGVPIVDTLLVVIVRFLERPKRRAFDRILRVFRADRNHLHHLLAELAPNRQSVVRIIYLLVLGSCAAALTIALTRNRELAWVTIVVEVVVVAAIRSLGMRRKLRAQVERERKQIWADVYGAGQTEASPTPGWRHGEGNDAPPGGAPRPVREAASGRRGE